MTSARPASRPHRRDISRRVALVGAAVAPLATPALAQSRSALRVGLATSPFVSDDLLLGHVAAMAEMLAEVTSGTLVLEVTSDPAPPGATVGAEIDAVAGPPDVWVDVDPAFGLFGACPCGLLPGEFAAWVLQADGQAVWDALGAEHGIKPLLIGDLGSRAAGWFSDPLQDRDSLRGLGYESFGLGDLTASALGGTGAARPRAHESLGLAADIEAGRPDGFPQFYASSLMRPQTALGLNVALPVWSALSRDHRAALEVVSMASVDAVTAAAVRAEAMAFKSFLTAGAQPASLPATVFEEVAATARMVAGDLIIGGSRVPYAWDSYQAFLTDIAGWTEIGDGAFSVARARALEV